MPYKQAHAPIYGYMKGYKHTIPLHLVHYARTFSIFKILNKINLGSVLNVGGADGYHSYLIQNLFGVETVTLDINQRALNDAAKKYKLSVVRGSATNIPFYDNCFDTAICIETIEHICEPQPVVKELKRVARNNVIISTESFFDSEEQRKQFLLYLRETHPQLFRCNTPVKAYDVNHFTREDFYTLFMSNDLKFHPQFSSKQAELLGPIEEVRNKVKMMTENIKANRQTKVIVHYCYGDAEMKECQLKESHILDNIVSEKPMFKMHLDEEMQAEDGENIQRIKNWHKEKEYCRVVSSDNIKSLQIEEEGAEKMSLQWLLPDDLERSPSYCTRKITLGAYGKTPRRTTSWEHQLYILKGRGELHEFGRTTSLNSGIAIQVRPCLSFEIINTSEDELVYLDVIPSITTFFGR